MSEPIIKELNEVLKKYGLMVSEIEMISSIDLPSEKPLDGELTSIKLLAERPCDISVKESKQKHEVNYEK
jgi:hypothetical protein